MPGTAPLAAARLLPDQLWWITAAVLLALAAVTAAAWAVDGRTLAGESLWAKPLRFQLSLALHLATLAVIAAALSPPWRGHPAVLALAWAVVAATAFEIVYVMVQAARGEASHFNTATPLLSALYSAMAVGAVVITLAAAVLGVAALFDRAAAMPLSLRWAVAAGLVGGAVLALWIGFRLGGQGGHRVGTEPPGAPRLPLTGWSLVVGDLRIPHFFATHMIQAVPLGGLIATRVLPAGAALAVVAALALAWLVATVWLFHHALAGRGFIR